MWLLFPGFCIFSYHFQDKSIAIGHQRVCVECPGKQTCRICCLSPTVLQQRMSTFCHTHDGRRRSSRNAVQYVRAQFQRIPHHYQTKERKKMNWNPVSRLYFFSLPCKHSRFSIHNKIKIRCQMFTCRIFVVKSNGSTNKREDG